MKYDQITFLISTMNKSSWDFLYKIFPDSDISELLITVVNQGGFLQNKFENIIALNTNSFGLSMSRNIALQNFSTDYAMIVDDDVTISKKYLANILSILIENQSDIITAKVWSPDGEFRKYRNQGFMHGKRSLLSVSSIEIILSRKVANEIRFDEEFGLGANFSTGEEIIFLNDALKMGFKIEYKPLYIVRHPKETSASVLDRKLLRSKYFMFVRLYNYVLGSFAFVIFILRNLRSLRL